MDMMKIASKVAKMAPVRKKSHILAEVPTVSMSRIQEMQVKAQKEGKTLADVMKAETKPDLFKTVSAKELKAINKRALETGEAPGKLLKEQVGENGDDRIEEETEEERADQEQVVEATETPVVKEGPVVEAIPEAPVIEEEAKTPATYEDVLGDTTLGKLKDFAKAAGLEFVAKIRKADLVALVLDKTTQSDFDAFFAE